MEAEARARTQANRLRRAMTPPEVMLWVRLRNRGLAGWKFRRQHPLGPYVLDLYCEAAKLAVEVDGWGHNLGGQPTRDVRRDAYLRSKGLKTLRLPAADVMRNVDGAMQAIVAACQSSSPSGEVARSEAEGR